MPFEQYIDKRFQQKSLDQIEQANEIIDEYRAQGFSLTVRQLFYQFVARTYIPNTKHSYDNLDKLIGNARMAGLVDWNESDERARRLTTIGVFVKKSLILYLMSPLALISNAFHSGSRVSAL